MNLRKLVALETARSLYRRQTVGNPLTQLFWECTLRCNFACRHCGSDCKASALQPDPPFSDFRKVLESVSRELDPHQITVIISGGEPLFRPDIASCGRQIYDMGFPWGMVTNAWLLDKARFVQLLKAGIHSLTISLDGIGDDHDWMRGKPGSFERASKAIRMVCDFNAACCADTAGDSTAGVSKAGALGFSNLSPDDAIAFDVVSCVNKRNVHKLQELKEHLISLGVRSWRLFAVFPSGRAAGDPELKLDSEEFKTLMEFIKATRREGRIHASYSCEGFLGDYEGEVRDNFYFCNAGISIASVRADGAISGCLSIRADYDQGNVRTDDFMDVWRTRFEPYRGREWMRAGICSTCRNWRWCLGNGMHLRDSEGKLALCRLKMQQE